MTSDIGADPGAEGMNVEQVLSVWTALDMRRRIVVVAATLAMFAAVLGLARMASQPSMALLYAGLDAPAAGEVVRALEARGVEYDVRGGAIYVPDTRRDELRMTLASEGLPANSAAGYELLDQLSGFGTTAQMFDATYWRAKEGELARTILSSPLIREARVHIASPANTGLRQRTPPTASVAVTTADGTLSGAHAKALKYLVASAVPGLDPAGVSVIDGRGGLILSGDDPEALPGGSDREDALKHNVQRLLEARVGYGNAVVEVSVETATDSETIHERIFDPDSRVAIATETEETTTTASDSRDSGVTVASNLPTGPGTAGTGGSSSSGAETRERVNYEISETTREILRAPGAVTRISVAVLVDGIRSLGEDGEEIWQPRPEEELAALHDLVASAVGFDEARGDIITIKSMQFEPLMTEAGTSGAGFLSGLAIDMMGLVRLAVLALVSLVLGLFVLRPVLTSARSMPPALAPPEPEASVAAPPPLPALSGEIDDGGFGDLPDLGVVSDFGFGDGMSGGTSDDPVERLRALIEERHDETVEILRGWMEDETEGEAA